MKRLLMLVGGACVLNVAMMGQVMSHCLTGEHPTPRMDFPDIRNLKSLRVVLDRTGCFGTCPQYRIEVHGDGSVVYEGSWYTKYCGEWRGTIPETAVRNVLSQFRAADYFRLKQKYQIDATDLPTYTTAISFDNVAKCVTDYGGNLAGMPTAVRDLEDAIDRLAGPEHWTTRQRIPSDQPEDCRGPFPDSPPALPARHLL